MDKTDGAADPANRLGLDYQDVPRWRTSAPLVDVHTHLYDPPHAALFFEAATRYGVETVFTMSPLEQVAGLRAEYADRLRFIAVPRWKDMQLDGTFRDQWLRDLAAFRERGARLCKFWMAPPMRERFGLTLDHAFMEPVIEEALQMGYAFMVHAGDPSVWWSPQGKYADVSKFGTKADQYPPLERFLDRVAPLVVIAAHMGGWIESPEFLAGLLARHANLVLDTSATKWIVREVARRPEAVRAFMIAHADRVLFGSDLVAREPYEHFDHYASRYWCQRTMWERDYRGESPIEDPDADDPPQLAGLHLPDDVLRAVYSGNIARLDLL